MIYDNFLDEHNLENIKKHKYIPGEYTSIDNFLNTYWNKLSFYLPKSVAPNVITLIGFFFNIFPFILAVALNPSLEGTISTFVTFFGIFSILAYQTFDALDGKHARNLKKSSPLGQLFDHGCDAIGTIFLVGIITASIGVDKNDEYKNLILVQNLNSYLAFFYSNWAEMYTHVLQTSSNNFGVTEVQLIFCLILPIFKYFNFYFTTIKIFSIKLKYLFNFVIFLIVLNKLFIISKHELLKIHHYKNILSFAIFYSCGVITIFIKENLLTLLIFSHGFIFCILTLKAILCSLTKKKYNVIHLEVIIHLIITIILFYVENKKLILLIWVIIEFILLVDFVYVNIMKISKFLNIKVLSIN